MAGAASVTTVLASRGYPDAPAKGAAIAIPDRLPEGVTVFHAGTARGADGVLRVNGGRVLKVTAVASSFAEAQRRSREAAEAIEFEGKIFRRDIGWREAARLAASAPLNRHRSSLITPRERFTFRAQCPSSPKSKPSSATSVPPCSAAASTGSP